jgi:hypothetical protein
MERSRTNEIESLEEYDVFKDIAIGTVPPMSYKNIRCHMIYDIKHNGRHQGRLVALTPVPDNSVYSGVICVRALRIIIFLSELNKLRLWGADVSSASLEASTQEKVYFVAGKEFGDLSGHTFFITKALYGLQSSGLRWHKKFFNILQALGF